MLKMNSNVQWSPAPSWLSCGSSFCSCFITRVWICSVVFASTCGLPVNDGTAPVFTRMRVSDSKPLTTLPGWVVGWAASAALVSGVWRAVWKTAHPPARMMKIHSVRLICFVHAAMIALPLSACLCLNIRRLAGGVGSCFSTDSILPCRGAKTRGVERGALVSCRVACNGFCVCANRSVGEMRWRLRRLGGRKNLSRTTGNF